MERSANSGGSWATMRWLSTRIEDRIRAPAIPSLELEQARQTLTQRSNHSLTAIESE